MSIVNNENPYCSAFNLETDLKCPSVDNMIYQNWQELQNISCYFIKTLENTINIKYVKSEDLALGDVTNGKSYGMIEIPADFSLNLIDLLLNGPITKISTENFIKIRLDNSNSLISQEIHKTIFNGLQKSFKKILISCGFSHLSESFSNGMKFHIVQEEIS